MEIISVASSQKKEEKYGGLEGYGFYSILQKSNECFYSAKTYTIIILPMDRNTHYRIDNNVKSAFAHASMFMHV